MRQCRGILFLYENELFAQNNEIFDHFWGTTCNFFDNFIIVMHRETILIDLSYFGIDLFYEKNFKKYLQMKKNSLDS